MKRLTLIALIAATTAALWIWANRPVAHPVVAGPIAGLAYSPMQPGQSPGREQYPSAAEIEADVALIARNAGAIRTYSLDGTLALIPEIAARFGLTVTAGVWLDRDLSANQRRLERLREVVAANPNITRVIVGNETILNGTLTPAELGGYLDAARSGLGVPVGTAETWNIWRAHPELATHVDFVAAHILPYWEGVSVVDAADRVDQRVAELEAEFPGKPVVIGEVGWPSKGRDFGAAVASRQNAEGFLRYFLDRAGPAGYDYFLMEAIDQPWKRADEGEVGAYWGLFDGDRQPKYMLGETFHPIPASGRLAAIAAALAIVAFTLLTLDARTMRWPGLALLAVTSTAVANGLVFSLDDYFSQYWTFAGIVGAGILLTGIVGAVLLLLIEAHEWAEAAFKPKRRLLGADGTLPAADPTVPATNAPPVSANAPMLAPAGPIPAAGTPVPAPRSPADTRAWPKVSIHVPAYAEPPAMLIETLNALAALDYPELEVIVVDNNTEDETLWRPVEAHCARLGPRFRFFHVAPLAGFKAGALNYALERTAGEAELIAVIDADYRVEPDWLARLVPEFDAPDVALVQAPQDYRDMAAHPFKAVCNAEYRGFFHIGMVTRNERNAIIQHGTMTLIRADVLREVGGWAEWTVTEDAELGLRILEHGYAAAYTSASHGRGLTPDRFRDYRSQRFRWAIGATQILRRHGRQLLGLAPSKLTPGQRFHFLTGWAAWLGDGLNLAFNGIAIGWTLLMLLSPRQFLAPVALFSCFVAALFAFKLAKVAWLYRTRVGASVRETLAAIVAGLALVYITGRAVLAGLGSGETRFVRTPKLARRDGLIGAVAAVGPELALGTTLAGLGIAVIVMTPMPTLDSRLWSALLEMFALPHLSAVSVSLLGALRGRRPSRVLTQLAGNLQRD